MAIFPENDEMNLKDLIVEIQKSAIQVNRRYQRSGHIWPARAKSFLVETVLLGMPIPRVLLHRLDAPQGLHHSDIIDGQQRCTVLRQFREGGFALTGAVDHAEALQGKRFSDLPAARKRAFESYRVLIDRYVGLSPKEIRQVFRRLNYYTAPLNAAEQRHAQFSGELCRFVEEQGRAWRNVFGRLRVFTKRQKTRKADEQLMAEVVDAMLHGVSTPTAASLRDVYKENDAQFSSASDFGRRLERARSLVGQWTWLQDIELMRKHYQMFSFLLALMHAEGSLAALKDELGPRRPILPAERVRTNVRRIEASEAAGDGSRYAQFWAASEEKTNVRENRLRRCKVYYIALAGS